MCRGEAVPLFPCWSIAKSTAASSQDENDWEKWKTGPWKLERLHMWVSLAKAWYHFPLSRGHPRSFIFSKIHCPVPLPTFALLKIQRSFPFADISLEELCGSGYPEQDLSNSKEKSQLCAWAQGEQVKPLPLKGDAQNWLLKCLKPNSSSSPVVARKRYDRSHY